MSLKQCMFSVLWRSLLLLFLLLFVGIWLLLCQRHCHSNIGTAEVSDQHHLCSFCARLMLRCTAVDISFTVLKIESLLILCVHICLPNTECCTLYWEHYFETDNRRKLDCSLLKITVVHTY